LSQVLTPIINLNPAEEDYFRDFQTSESSETLRNQASKTFVDDESDEGGKDGEGGTEGEEEDNVCILLLQPSYHPQLYF